MGILSETCALGVGVVQIMQDSLGMKRTSVFTLNVMEPLGCFEQKRDDLVT